MNLGSIPTADLIELRALLKYSEDQPRDERGRFAGGGADLDVHDYEGQTGNRSHITRTEQGTIPTAAIAHMRGERGELPRAHRNMQGERWQSFKDDIRQNGIKSPIFIVVDPGKDAQISEGNHRRDAAVELGMERVPVEIRYFGHSEQDGTVMQRAGLGKRDVSDEERDDHGRWSAGGDGAPDLEALGRLGDPRASHQAAWDVMSHQLNSMRNPSTHERGMGNCYPAAYRIADRADELGLVNPVVCQGTCTPRTGALKDVPYSHAWVEAETPFGRLAYDYSSHNQVQMPADMYRGMGRLTAVTEYTPEEARAAALRTGHYGPWK
jgi:hypothetical protein